MKRGRDIKDKLTQIKGHGRRGSEKRVTSKERRLMRNKPCCHLDPGLLVSKTEK